MLEQSGDGAFQEESEKEEKTVREGGGLTKQIRNLTFSKQPQPYFWKLSAIFSPVHPTSLPGSGILLVHIILAKHRSSHYVVFNTAVNTEYVLHSSYHLEI